MCKSLYKETAIKTFTLKEKMIYIACIDPTKLLRVVLLIVHTNQLMKPVKVYIYIVKD